MFKLKHDVSLKLPKFLGNQLDKLTEEEKEKFGNIALLCGGGLLAISVIYLTGYNKGIRKAIDNRGIYIIKSGGN
jgi:hypothetical protein